MTYGKIEADGVVILLDHAGDEFIERTPQPLVLGVLGEASYNQPGSEASRPDSFNW